MDKAALVVDVTPLPKGYSGAIKFLTIPMPPPNLTESNFHEK
jgi:hypothetical protein